MRKTYCDRCGDMVRGNEWFAVRVDDMEEQTHKHIDLCTNCWGEANSIISNLEVIAYLP